MMPPKVTLIRQQFPADHLANLEESVRSELAACPALLQAGTRVAIAVGSRGITSIDRMVREVVRWVRDRGAEPMIVPAMGSHGGATAEGQRDVLAGYGITEENVGAPVRASMAVVELPQGDAETKVFYDREAAAVDATILVNRVKVHTSFHGDYESGLMKMMAIGLGKHVQAAEIHRLGVRGLQEVMPQVARQVLRHANILLGLAVVENAYDQPMLVRAIPAARIPEQEPALLDIARKNMPCLPVDQLDLLVVDRIGKNISGLGMDPNIIGRLKIRGQPEPQRPDIRFITIHDLTPESRGNAIGMGLADVATRNLFDKIDFKATYANVITSTFLERAKVPLIAETDLRAVQIALEACGFAGAGEARLARIQDTLRLDEVQVSAALLRDIQGRSGVEIVGSPRDLFDAAGRLTPW